MALNVLRNEMVVFTSVVEDVKANNPKCANAKNTDKLLKFLEHNEQLNNIVYDQAATDAVIKNNKEKIAAGINPANVPFGGNVLAL